MKKPIANELRLADLEAVIAKEQIRKNIWCYRLQREMTQAQLAHMIGCRRSHMSRIETGQLVLTHAGLQAIAQALDVSTDALRAVSPGSGEDFVRDEQERILLQRFRELSNVQKVDVLECATKLTRCVV